jgi:glucose/arabinose dehydrogenase
MRSLPTQLLTQCLLTLCLLSTLTSVRAADYELHTIAQGFNFPWSVSFMPGGDYIVAMRSGELRVVAADGDIGEPVDNVPETYVAGQGGFFDVVLHPQFAQNKLLYLSFAYGSPAANGTRVISAEFNDNSLSNVTELFTVSPLKDTAAHYGGKLVIQDDGSLLMTTGDGFEYREAAQDKNSLLGKIVRFNADGSAPSDNPFAGDIDGNQFVWAYGNRNPQGLVIDPLTGIVYEHEHGPRGGDELNIIEKGNNYGWPAVTHGINYSYAYVSPLQTAPGITESLSYWVPSIAPSGLAIYRGEKFPEWDGDLFVGALVDKDVKRVEMDDGIVVSQESLFGELGARIRDVRLGPDGYLYLLTDSDTGALIQVKPASE